MPGYIAQALHKFHHAQPTKPQHSPHQHQEIQYGSQTQMTTPADTSPPLTKEGITRLQQIIGTLLYYARAVDSTMLVALSNLSSAQAHGTEATNNAAAQLLDYCATHPEASICYCASEMALQVHSDASYLSVPKGRSRAGGHFFLGAQMTSIKPILNNGAVLTVSSIIKHVMSSAAEAEIAGLFINAKEGEIICTTLDEMGYPQNATPIQTDNSTASGIANDTINQQRSRSIVMRFILGTRSRQTRTLQSFLGTGKNQSRRLFHQTPSTQTSPTIETNLPPNTRVKQQAPEPSS
jgi:hypothetical protein